MSCTVTRPRPFDIAPRKVPVRRSTAGRSNTPTIRTPNCGSGARDVACVASTRTSAGSPCAKGDASDIEASSDSWLGNPGLVLYGHAAPPPANFHAFVLI